jgi:hypothetical protein
VDPVCIREVGGILAKAGIGEIDVTAIAAAVDKISRRIGARERLSPVAAASQALVAAAHELRQRHGSKRK